MGWVGGGGLCQVRRTSLKDMDRVEEGGIRIEEGKSFEISCFGTYRVRQRTFITHPFLVTTSSPYQPLIWV